jgi:hypothetical protein
MFQTSSKSQDNKAENILNQASIVVKVQAIYVAIHQIVVPIKSAINQSTFQTPSMIASQCSCHRA